MKSNSTVVCGAGGFIGGHLVASLRRVGARNIRAVDQKPFDLVEEIAGVKLKRRYNLQAPKGVNCRNSDNAKIREVLHWEPSISLRDGLEKTYRWIYDEMASVVHQ